MTEAEWLACNRPWQLMSFLGQRISGRHRRLLLAACLRQSWDLLTDPRSRAAVEVTERFADGEATEDERMEARLAAYRAQLPSGGVQDSPARAAFLATHRGPGGAPSALFGGRWARAH